MKRLAAPLAALLIFSLGFSLGAPSAASAATDVANFSVNVDQASGTQGGMYVSGQGFNSSSKSAASSLTQAAGTCTFNSMLSELLSSFITYLLEALVSDAVTETPLILFKAPVHDSINAAQGKATRAKEVCAWAPYGFCVLPSLDSIAYCFVNQIIDYIGKATVEWIKTGFQGSPAFIDDPEKFFTNAVDTVAGNLLNQISDGLLCEPWRAQVQVKLLNEHTSSFKNNAGCKLSEISDKWESFADGDSDSFSWDLQYSYSQDPYNNPVGSLIEARNAFNVQLASTKNGLQVQAGWSNGFLQVKDPETGRITTPGRVIESQLNRRLGNAENRLLIADEFDEIINTLVNELVKMALSELFDGDGDSESEDGELEAEIEYEDDEEDDSSDDSTDEEEETDPDGGTDGEGTDLDAACVLVDDEVDEGDTATAKATVSGYVGFIYFDWTGEASLANSFSQSSSATTSTATAVFNDEGRYDLEIRVADEDWDGEVETITCPTLEVHEDFAVSCTVSDSTITPGERVTYTSSVVGADGEITDRDWGGATSGLGESIEKTYGSTGTYSVHVEIADEEGNREEADCPTVTVAN